MFRRRKLQLMERFDLIGCTGTGHRRYASACSDRSGTREDWKMNIKSWMAKIAELKAILADEKKLLWCDQARRSLLISDKYGDDRRTAIGYDEYDMSMEDLIPDDDIVVTMTNLGYIKTNDQWIISRARTAAARESRACRPLRKIISKIC